jgi:hypothetical protein
MTAVWFVRRSRRLGGVRSRSRVRRREVLPYWSCRLLPAVGAGRYRPGMDGVTTYEQLQAMTPEQRRAHFFASIVLDPATVRPGMQRRLEEMGVELDER